MGKSKGITYFLEVRPPMDMSLSFIKQEVPHLKCSPPTFKNIWKKPQLVGGVKCALWLAFYSLNSEQLAQ